MHGGSLVSKGEDTDINSADQPVVFVVADHDDEDIPVLLARLDREGISAHWLALGLDESEYEVELTPTSFELACRGVTLNEAALLKSRLMIYRRHRLDDFPPVTVSFEDASETSFAEREWRTTIDALLRMIEMQHQLLHWGNSPQALSLTSNKISLLHQAIHSGFTVPSFVVSNYSRLPQQMKYAGYIAKAINLNEVIDSERSYRTSALMERDLKGIVNQRVPCPSLIQARIPVSHELRCCYCFGSTVGIKIVSGVPYVDVRLVAPEELSVTLAEPPDRIRRGVRAYCTSLGLNLCVFDFMVVGDSYWLTDVTPNGSWSGYERYHGVEVNRRLAVAIRRSLERRWDAR